MSMIDCVTSGIFFKYECACVDHIGRNKVSVAKHTHTAIIHGRAILLHTTH